MVVLQGCFIKTQEIGPNGEGVTPRAAHTGPAHLSSSEVFQLESVVRYAALVCCPEFGGCPPIECIMSARIAVGIIIIIIHYNTHQ